MVKCPKIGWLVRDTMRLACIIRGFIYIIIGTRIELKFMEPSYVELHCVDDIIVICYMKIF